MKKDKYIQSAHSAGRRLVKVPVRINAETIEEFQRLYPDTMIEMTRIGAREYPCAVCWLPEGEADAFLVLQEREAKREQQESRCLLPDGKGGFIRCPAGNLCGECQKARSFHFDSMLPVSLDALYCDYEEAEEARDWSDDGETGMREPGTEDDGLMELYEESGFADKAPE